MRRSTYTDNSTVVKFVRRARSRLQIAVENAETLQLLGWQPADRSESADPDASQGPAPAGGGPTAVDLEADEDQAPSTPQTEEDPESTPGAETAGTEQRSVTSSSRIYRAFRSGTRVGGSSWLYRWLTSEPEPDVIVIDLRETRTVGPILKRLNRLIVDLSPGTASSSVVRTGYRIRARFLGRPLRLLSFVLIAVVLVAFAAIAVSGTQVTPLTLLLFAVLILALRGTQSSRTWEDIEASRVTQWLVAAFEPPEPPESPAEADGPDSTETTGGGGDEDSEDVDSEPA